MTDTRHKNNEGKIKRRKIGKDTNKTKTDEGKQKLKNKQKETEISNKIKEKLNSPSNVLLSTSSLSNKEENICFSLLTPSSPFAENLLIISYNQTIKSFVDTWKEKKSSLPDETKMIKMDEKIDEKDIKNSDLKDNRLNYSKMVNNPKDLQGLGIKINDVLSKWKENGKQTVVCFNSLSVLLEYTDRDTAVNFLKVILDSFRKNDVIAHFHIDPNRHSEKTINTLEELFDATIKSSKEENTVDINKNEGDINQKNNGLINNSYFGRFTSKLPSIFKNNNKLNLFETNSVKLNKDDGFKLLSNKRRRYILHFLKEKEKETNVRDLAEQVAAWEENKTVKKLKSKERKNVYVSLYQTHLPEMDKKGVIDYNKNRGTVKLNGFPEVYLKLNNDKYKSSNILFLGLSTISSIIFMSLFFEVYPFYLLSEIFWLGIITLLFGGSTILKVAYEKSKKPKKTILDD